MRTTERKINELLREGRGVGTGKEYIPWIKVGDFSSYGRGNKIYGVKSGRDHHFFSDLEARYYYILLWSDAVVDIREQYPLLPVNETEEIAARLEVKHPKDNLTEVSPVMTTDFLITVKNGDEELWEARFVKPSIQLNNPRVEEKRLIEELYWKARQVPFKVVTEKSYSRVKADNIQQIMAHYPTPLPDSIDDTKRMDMAYALLHGINDNTNLQLRNLTSSLDNRFDVPAGSTLFLFYHMAAHKLIPVKIDKKFLPTKKIEHLIDIPALATMDVFKEGELLEHYA